MVDLIAAWLPLIIFLVLFLAFGWSTQRSYKKHVDEVNAVREIVETNREMIAELRGIKQILKDRK